MASSRFRSRLTLGQTVNRVAQRLQYYTRNPAPKRLQAGVVTAPTVARDAITGDNIVDGSVPGDKIEDGTITGQQIQAGSITADEIAAGTIRAENIEANTITADQINARAIGSEELAIGAVFAENIAADAVRAQHIFAGSIESEHLKVGIELNAPLITGGYVDMTGVIRGTRLITNDIIGIGPEDLTDPVNYPDGAPQLAIADRLSLRPWVANPGVDFTSQIDLYQNGRVNITATDVNAFTVNDKILATRNHTHANQMSHGQDHNPTRAVASDRRLKKEIRPLSLGLDLIGRLQPVEFKMINGDGSLVIDPETTEPVLDEHGEHTHNFREGKRTHFGLIAQDVQSVMSDLGIDFAGHVIPDYEEHPDGMQQLDLTQLIAPLILAVQELSAQVDDLRAQLR